MLLFFLSFLCGLLRSDYFLSLNRSIVKDVEEALVELFLPKHTLCRNSNDYQALIRSRVYIDELALLRLEVCLAGTFGVLSRLV